MTKAVELSLKQWAEIHNLIAKHYPHSVLLIRNRMKEVLGFTVRRHTEWIKYNGEDHNYLPRHLYREQIHLDFYDEPKRTMFLLRYSDIIGKTSLDSDIE
jgi:hypothetical protein